jgi:hypothetical protein
MSFRPPQEPSISTSVHLPPELHRQVRSFCLASDISMRTFFTRALRDALKRVKSPPLEEVGCDG